MRYGFSSEKIRDVKYSELADLKTALRLRTSVWWHVIMFRPHTLEKTIKIKKVKQ
jgi:hypothetical protein